MHEGGGWKSGKGVNTNTHLQECVRVLRNAHALFRNTHAFSRTHMVHNHIDLERPKPPTNLPHRFVRRNTHTFLLCHFLKECGCILCSFVHCASWISYIEQAKRTIKEGRNTKILPPCPSQKKYGLFFVISFLSFAKYKKKGHILWM
jgi:hypothetical protein